MKVGYIRVSTNQQNVSRQRESLEDYGCDEIFIDKASGKNLQREQYQKMKEFIRKDDIVVFAELDRLGRTKKDIDNEWNDLINKGVDIVILDMPLLDTTKYQDDLGKLMVNLAKEIFGYMAEQERLKILERQRQGIEIAKEQGKFQGTPKFYRPDSNNKEHRRIYFLVKRMLQEKKPILRIADQVGISRNTVYRIKQDIELQNEG